MRKHTFDQDLIDGDFEYSFYTRESAKKQDLKPSKQAT